MNYLRWFADLVGMSDATSKRTPIHGAFGNYGLFVYDALATILGLVLIVLGKLWFLDRMVWLYQDMKDRDGEYASWLY